MSSSKYNEKLTRRILSYQKEASSLRRMIIASNSTHKLRDGVAIAGYSYRPAAGDTVSYGVATFHYKEHWARRYPVFWLIRIFRSSSTVVGSGAESLPSQNIRVGCYRDHQNQTRPFSTKLHAADFLLSFSFSPTSLPDKTTGGYISTTLAPHFHPHWQHLTSSLGNTYVRIRRSLTSVSWKLARFNANLRSRVASTGGCIICLFTVHLSAELR